MLKVRTEADMARSSIEEMVLGFFGRKREAVPVAESSLMAEIQSIAQRLKPVESGDFWKGSKVEIGESNLPGCHMLSGETTLTDNNPRLFEVSVDAKDFLFGLDGKRQPTIFNNSTGVERVCVVDKKDYIGCGVTTSPDGTVASIDLFGVDLSSVGVAENVSGVSILGLDKTPRLKSTLSEKSLKKFASNTFSAANLFTYLESIEYVQDLKDGGDNSPITEVLIKMGGFSSVEKGRSSASEPLTIVCKLDEAQGKFVQYWRRTSSGASGDQITEDLLLSDYPDLLSREDEQDKLAIGIYGYGHDAPKHGSYQLVLGTSELHDKKTTFDLAIVEPTAILEKVKSLVNDATGIAKAKVDMVADAERDEGAEYIVTDENLGDETPFYGPTDARRRAE